MNSTSYISIDSEKLETAKRLLSTIPKGFERAFKNAGKRASQSIQHNASDEVMKRYDITKSNIRASENVKIIYETDANGISVSTVFAGYSIPLYRYTGTTPATDARKDYSVPVMVKGKWTMQRPSVPASAHQLKGTKVTRFRNAFIATMQSGHTGIFERTGNKTSDKSDQIKELKGLSVAQMVGSESVRNALSLLAANKFSERFDHEVERLVNGY